MPRTLEEEMARLDQDAREIRSVLGRDPAPEPEVLTVQHEAVEKELREADRDGTHRLFTVPRTDNVRFQQLLGALTDRMRKRMSQPGAKQVVGQPEPERSYTVAIKHAESVKKRVVAAIDGNHSNPERAQEMRSAVLGGRTVMRTRAGWEAEMKLELAAILALGDAAPPALEALVPGLEEAALRLDMAETKMGRPRSDTTVWSPEVLQDALALHLAFGELLSWASVTATEKRLAALMRILVPRRRAESRAEETEDAAPAPAPAASGMPTSGPVTATEGMGE